MLLPSVVSLLAMQHYQNDGNLLRALATTLLLETLNRGSCLIDKPDGKNAKDWTIRSQASKLDMIEYEEGSTT